MKFYSSLLALLLLGLNGTAYAHAHLHASTPANNSTIAVLPKTMNLEFNEAIKLTALTIQQGDGQPKNLTPLPAEAAKQVSVPMPALSSGSYVVKWRALSADGHIMSGKFVFTLAK